MIYLSQRDPAWAEDKLGVSTLTVGRYGCTTTCISMLSDYFGSYKTPKELAHNAYNYTPTGLVLWTHLAFDKMKFVWREYFEDTKRIDAAIKDPKQAVILQVNHGQHWVVALRKTWYGNDYLVLDPWDGSKCFAKKKYHNISGAAFFSSK
jgi:hypothetical protein